MAATVMGYFIMYAVYLVLKGSLNEGEGME
jgi:hypothetical protein